MATATGGEVVVVVPAGGGVVEAITDGGPGFTVGLTTTGAGAAMANGVVATGGESFGVGTGAATAIGDGAGAAVGGGVEIVVLPVAVDVAALAGLAAGGGFSASFVSGGEPVELFIPE
jgi:hypothetical protein